MNINAYAVQVRYPDSNLFPSIEEAKSYYQIAIKVKAGKGSWLSRIDDPSWKAWSGYAYENICQLHVEAIKKRLE